MNSILLAWRKSLKLTQEEMASKVNVHPRTINNWENNKTEPEEANLRRVAESLGIDLSDFLSGPDAYREKQEAILSQPRGEIKFIQRENTSKVFSKINADLEHSFSPGSCPSLDPEKTIFVLLNKNGQPSEITTMVMIGLGVEPLLGDEVLVYHEGKSRIVKWTETSKVDDYDKFYGPITGRVTK